jgi:hypothetical protein
MRLGWGSSFVAPARALLRRNAHATRAPARFAVSICGTQNLGKRLNSLRSDNAASDPKFLRSSSPGLLLGGVGIAPQQCTLDVRRLCANTTYLVAAHAIFYWAAGLKSIEEYCFNTAVVCRRSSRAKRRLTPLLKKS